MIFSTRDGIIWAWEKEGETDLHTVLETPISVKVISKFQYNHTLVAPSSVWNLV